MVTAVDPRTTEAAGGRAVVVSGSAFVPTAELHCLFGNEVRPATWVSSGELRCLSPPQPAGAGLTVRVSLNGQQVGQSNATLSYFGCEPGSAAPNFQEPCLPCPPGTHQPAVDARYCLDCPEVSFAPSNGSQDCTPCPANTATSGAATAETSCLCLEGYYEADQRPGKPCEACKLGGVCKGKLEVPRPLTGYWPSDLLAHHFLECKPASACHGGPDGGCTRGYQGRVCGECSPGFFRQATHCRPCPTDHTTIALRWVIGGVLLGGTFAVLCYFVIFKAQHRKDALSTLAIGITYWQTIGLFHGYDLSWPAQVDQAMHLASFFDFNIELAQPECSIQLTYQHRWQFVMLLPLAVATLQTGATSAAYRVFHQRVTWAELRDKSVNVGLLCLNVMYVPLASQSLEVVDCTKQPDGTWTLDASPSVQCHTGWWTTLLPMMVFFNLVYTLGIPLAFLAIVRHFRGELHKPEVRSRFSALLHKYQPSHSGWEVAVCLRKLGIVLVRIFLTNRPFLGAVLATLVLLAAFIGHMVYHPYHFESNNRLETITLSSTMFLIMSGIAFEAGQWPSEGVATVVGWVDVAVLVLVSGYVVAEMLRSSSSTLAASRRTGTDDPTTTVPSEAGGRQSQPTGLEDRDGACPTDRSQGQPHADQSSASATAVPLEGVDVQLSTELSTANWSALDAAPDGDGDPWLGHASSTSPMATDPMDGRIRETTPSSALELESPQPQPSHMATTSQAGQDTTSKPYQEVGTNQDQDTTTNQDQNTATNQDQGVTNRDQDAAANQDQKLTTNQDQATTTHHDPGLVPTSTGKVGQQATSGPVAQETISQETISPSRQAALERARRAKAELAANAAGQAAVWELTDGERKRYDTMFAAADVGKLDRVSRKQSGLNRSGLPQELLHQIWTLADADEDGLLSPREFRVACHLATRVKNHGLKLPTTLPRPLSDELQTADGQSNS